MKTIRTIIATLSAVLLTYALVAWFSVRRSAAFIQRTIYQGFDQTFVVALVMGSAFLLIAVILPGMDGLTICRRLREMGSRIPIVMMTRSESVEKRVLCLNLGADDFLIRYFEMMEMEARIRAVVRRSRQHNTPLILRWGGLELNPCTHTVLCDGTPLHLRPICFTMLACLMRSAPGIVTREELTREVYGDSPPDSDSLRTHIHLLRRALEKQGKPILQTVTHVGFRLEG